MINEIDKSVTDTAWSLVQTCESHLNEQSVGRERAQEYYNGVMKDMPADEGRSSVVSKDVRGIIKKIMPSIKRALFSNDKIVEYDPVGQEDEDQARQATDYVNHVVIPECGAERAIEDALLDAAVVKTGILKWSAYEETKVTTREYTGIPESEMIGLDGVGEILDLESKESDENDPITGTTEVLNDFKLRRKEEAVNVRLECIPRGNFLIYPMAKSIEESPIVGEILDYTRSDFVSMGYDREKVDQLASDDATDDGDDESTAGDDYTSDRGDVSKAMQAVRAYEVYIKLDEDNDGIAELYRMVFGEGKPDGEKTTHVVLGFEAVIEAPYADLALENDAHQFEGHSIFEDVEDIMRVKTAMFRNTLDNVYWQNNLQPIVQADNVEDMDAVNNPSFGRPIMLKQGKSVKDSIDFHKVPFVANHSFQMLGYMDEVAKDRTGITDASGGLDPSQLMNTSATAANLMAEGGIAQSEMIIRNIARGGLRKAFKGLLRLIVAHHDKPRTKRIRGEWVEFNPAVWNVDMDCTVNVGLGAGSRERDMMALQMVKATQAELLQAFGPDNPFVKPENLHNMLEKMTEVAGFVSADPYFTKPNDEEIAAKLEAQKKAPNPEMEKIKAQMALEQQKAQGAQAKEKAQMDADLTVKQVEIKEGQIARREKLQADAALSQQKLEFEREKLQAETALKMAEIRARYAPAVGGDDATA
jgi:hypothetical protein